VNGGAPVAPGSVTGLGGIDNAFDVVLSPGAADGDTVELRIDLAQVTDAGSTPAGVGGDCETGGLLDRHGPEVRAYVVFREHAAVLPSLAGDVTGPIGTTVVERIRGRTVSPAAPTANGQVLTWNQAQARWEASALPPVSGDVAGPLTAVTVTRIQGRNVSPVAPTANGQVLTWNQAQTRWEATALPASALPPGSNDVSGTYPALTVTRIQGRNVSPAAPTGNGQVLTWNQAQTRWEPAAPPAATLPPATMVGQFLVWNGTAWVASAGPAATGQFLTWSGTQWVTTPQPTVAGQSLVWTIDPTNGRGSWQPFFAVQAPGGVYRIVAAGHFSIAAIPGNATPIGAVYNATTVRVTLPGAPGRFEITVGFGAAPVPAGFTYVVKGTLSSAESLTAAPLVFQRVTTAGLVLGASFGFNSIERVDRIMLEINRIG